MTTSEEIMACFKQAVGNVAERIRQFAIVPGVGFTRTRLLSPATVLEKQVAMAAKSSKNELLELFCAEDRPSRQGWQERLDQMNDSAFKALLDEYNELYHALASSKTFSILDEYNLLAVDGSSFRYPSDARYSDETYLTHNGSSKGTYSVHLVALYNLVSDLYEDGVIQSAHEKNEFKGLCDMIDRAPKGKDPDKPRVYIADRGFCSYNDIAHVLEAQQFFLSRSKDIESKGILKNLNLPQEGTFDKTVEIELIRSHSKKVKTTRDNVRYIGKNVAFDFLASGSLDTYILSFRVVRIRLESGEYETLLTNLPRDVFGPDDLERLYNVRWGEETSFRELKYTLGTIEFHSKKPNRIRQEIWANMIRYNLSASMMHAAAEQEVDQRYIDMMEDDPSESSQRAIIDTETAATGIPDRIKLVMSSWRPRKYAYTINFSTAVSDTTRCLKGQITPREVEADIRKELIPLRPAEAFLVYRQLTFGNLAFSLTGLLDRTVRYRRTSCPQVHQQGLR